jgi:hypothetical protein
MSENDIPERQGQEGDSPGDADSPGAGYPAEETEPLGGTPDKPHEHPEEIGDTPSDEDGAEDVTESPGSPAESGPD